MPLFTVRDDANYIGSTNGFDLYRSFDGREIILQIGDREEECKTMDLAFIHLLADVSTDYAMAYKMLTGEV